ncbi:M domain protein [Clostridium sp.]|uniref:M domain protein n=1 Tax=Clostridium sp. TaxID=1506 RepID=UPI001A48D012|nr:M domain protein [Clostridium sp.]MBK5240767.1 M domain protein [Clostridium sp.]
MENETKKMFEMLMGKLDTISESQKNMQIRQDEIFSVVKAIEHSNTTHKAEIDNIIYKVAHTEGTINKIGNVISESRVVK